MDNLKYYNDSFAYNYDHFVSQPKKKAEIHDYPAASAKKKTKSNADRARVHLVRNIIISGLVVISVCASLFLRAEISSMNSEINSINEQIVELESEATRLEVELERKVSIINLEESAIELGMQKCEKSQVTYINTNNIDTAQNSDGELTSGQNID